MKVSSAPLLTIHANSFQFRQIKTINSDCQIQDEPSKTENGVDSPESCQKLCASDQSNGAA